jgi:hypothetical protein
VVVDREHSEPELVAPPRRILDEIADRHRLPVLYVTVPPAATARMLAVEFARFLGLEFTGRANITDIVNAVCATAAHTRVELVCIDELHNLNLATRAGAEVSDQLKYFAERYLQLNRPPSSMPASMWMRKAYSPVSAAAKSPAGSPSSPPRPSPTAPAPNASSGVR